MLKSKVSVKPDFFPTFYKIKNSSIVLTTTSKIKPDQNPTFSTYNSIFKDVRKVGYSIKKNVPNEDVGNEKFISNLEALRNTQYSILNTQYYFTIVIFLV